MVRNTIVQPDSAVSSRAAAQDAQSSTAQSIKETLESLIIAFVLAFVFRAFVVEAFVIPTGSMAPTLLGQHVRLTDPAAGYRYTVDRAAAGRAVAPMSGQAQRLDQGTYVSQGDRILVLKYVYSVSDPNRWDVVVFKNPETPKQNFIKRLIGLPGEQIWIIDGNIYVKPDGGPWRIARKTEHPKGEKVQRAVWQPIYHSEYVPLPRTRTDSRWTVPWHVADGRWRLDRHDELEAEHGYHCLSDQPATLTFDFEDYLADGAPLYAYNQPTIPAMQRQPIEDVRLAATFVPQQSGLSVTLLTTARLDSPDSRPLELSAQIEADGGATLIVTDPADGQQRVVAGPVQVRAFAADQPRRIELWYVDQQASLWVDGDRVLAWGFGLPIQTLVDRSPPARRPERLEVQVDGSPVSIYEVHLDRDLYYTSESLLSGEPGHAILVKAGDRREGEPIELLDDQFFCLGDNSPRSSDGRLWEDDSLEPWVRHDMFAEDPTPSGIVPRGLLIGRAFFVYWPAHYTVGSRRYLVLPNFGDMRVIY